MAIKKNKVLIISYDFFPDNSPNTYRWLNILKEWRKEEIDIFVVSSKKRILKNYDEIDGIKIYRTGDSLLDNIKNILFKLSHDIDFSKSTKTQNFSSNGFLRFLYNQTWKKFYFPDFAFLWQSSAYRKAKELIERENISNIITVSWPFSAHVVGYRLKLLFNINWIADTIDPFYLSDAVNNNFFYRKVNKKLESKVLTKSDFITLLTSKMKNAYVSLYPQLENKIIINHNIYVPIQPQFIHVFNKNTSIVKLVFVGTLTKITREPFLLLKFFNYLVTNTVCENSYELHIYGTYHEFTNDFLKQDGLLRTKVFLHDFIDRVEVTKVIAESDIVVNIGNNNKYQEPSKVLEYVYMQKPILNICSIKDDTTKELLKFYPHTFNVDFDQIYNAKLINDFHEFYKKNAYININYTKYLKKYSLDEVQMKYLKLLVN